MPRLLFCSPAADGAATRQVLQKSGAGVDSLKPGQVEPGSLALYDAIILEGKAADHEVWQLCRRCRAHASDDFVPILILAGDPGARLLGLQAGADACLTLPVAPAELDAQVQALIRLKKLFDRAHERTDELVLAHKKLRQAYQQVGQELELARRLQQSLLPQTLPRVPGVRFAVNFRPCGRVGGDFYDVFRLDEAHIGFFVADVMGHGVPACLLTMFLKSALRPKEIVDRTYRLAPPDEVLHHLNREILHQELAENPFIAMVYGLYNVPERRLIFARAGHPHPLLVPRSGPLRFLEVHGSLLGIFETEFSVHAEKLNLGDKVLFSTDGLESAETTSKTLMARVPEHRFLAPFDQLGPAPGQRPGKPPRVDRRPDLAGI